MPLPSRPSWAKVPGRIENPTKVLPEEMLILGQPAGSSLEWRISEAAKILKVTFQYQVPLNTGRRLRGGYVLDFLFETVPLPTPAAAQGEYWHGSQRKRLEDAWKLAHIKEWLDYQCVDPVELWENECLTIAQAVTTMRRLLKL